MITGDDTIKRLFNKRKKKDYNINKDRYLYHLLYGYLMLNVDDNNCVRIDNEFVVEIASFLEDSEYTGVEANIASFFDKDCFYMFDKARDDIWNGDYAWEGTTKFNFSARQAVVNITDEKYYYQSIMDDMIDERRCKEYT